ncbi:MAG: alpha/beta hydrolase [Spirochaetales bacterium]|nr:alpha/beta hydrolase [Spirochaetales bacterium]
MSLTIKTLLIFAVLLVLLLIALPLLGIYTARSFCLPRAKGEAEVIGLCTEEAGDFELEWFNTLDFKSFTVPSPRGYDLNGVYLDGESDKTIILCHGHTMTWQTQVKYMPYLLEKGWNIIAYNHRYHGTSGGDICTGGYYEKLDLGLICDWAFEHYPNTETFGVQGESMGAATVLQYLPLDERLDFVWADCPYDDFADILSFHMDLYHIPGFLHKPILYFADRYINKRAGIHLADVSPREAIMEKPVPLFLVHGNGDTYVPYFMSERMYQMRKDYAPTCFVTIEGAEHVKSHSVDSREYDSRLDDFLNSLEG